MSTKKLPFHIWEYNSLDFHQMTILMPKLPPYEEYVSAQWSTRRQAEQWAHRNCAGTFRVLQCIGPACPVEKRLADHGLHCRQSS